MKKLIISSFLALSITALAIFGGNMNLFNNTVVATASAIDNIKESKPTDRRASCRERVS